MNSAMLGRNNNSVQWGQLLVLVYIALIITGTLIWWGLDR